MDKGNGTKKGIPQPLPWGVELGVKILCLSGRRLLGRRRRRISSVLPCFQPRTLGYASVFCSWYTDIWNYELNLNKWSYESLNCLCLQAGPFGGISPAGSALTLRGRVALTLDLNPRSLWFWLLHLPLTPVKCNYLICPLVTKDLVIKWG